MTNRQKPAYSSSDKVRFYHIYSLLLHTDENSPLTINQVLEGLRGMGIEVERKAAGRDIQIIDYIGREIEQKFHIQRHKDNKKGFYFVQDSYKYEDWEIKALIDAVAAARFLSKEEAERLIGKLKTECSPDGRAALQHARPVNSHIRAKKFTRYGIDNIFTAIKEKQAVTFKYMGLDKDLTEKPRRGGRTYTVSPYRLYWQDERYYLVGNNHKYNDLSTYRLDRMREVGFTNGNFKPPEDILGENAAEKLEEYIKDSIYRYSGQKITLRLFCAGMGTVADFLDRFGDNIKVQKAQDGYELEIPTTESEGLIYWLMQYGKYVKVLEPESVKQAFRAFLQEAVKMNG